jgi:hypothetical protein
MQYLNGVLCDCVENLKWIPDQRNDAHFRSFNQLLRAFRHSGNSGDRCSDVRFKGRGHNVAKHSPAIRTDFCRDRRSRVVRIRLSSRPKAGESRFNLFLTRDFAARYLRACFVDRVQLLRSGMVHASSTRLDLAHIFGNLLLILLRQGGNLLE